MIPLCFFFNDAATTVIYTYLHTLSLHGALPISAQRRQPEAAAVEHAGEVDGDGAVPHRRVGVLRPIRSEEHTSELQSLMRISYAVFCLKKKKVTDYMTNHYRNLS